jgi:L-fuconolactonase
VTATILVQAAPTAEETDYLLGLAQAHAWIAGVVGWIDLAAEAAISEVRRRAAQPLFVAVRPMLQDLPDREWILQDQIAPALVAISKAGLVFDALIRSDQLPVASELARRHPDLSIVIDHAAKPPFGRVKQMSAWRDGLSHAAAHPNVYCKLSGLLTELPQADDLEAVEAAIEDIVAVFGPTRVIWGSDWPVLTLAGNYGDWLSLCRAAITDEAARSDIFTRNARRAYRRMRASPDLPTTELGT